jgi:hypothetical protein
MLTYELLNPGQTQASTEEPSDKLNVLLNEGLAEFFAARSLPNLFASRAAVLKRGGGVPITLSQINELLNTKEYPKGAAIQSFYSEGTVFVRWIMDMPNGMQLLKNLFSTNPKDMEGMVRMHQRNNSLSPDGFASYIPYRENALKTLK